MLGFAVVTGVGTPAVLSVCNNAGSGRPSIDPSKPTSEECPYDVKLTFSSPATNNQLWIDPLGYFDQFSFYDEKINCNWIKSEIYDKKGNEVKPKKLDGETNIIIPEQNNVPRCLLERIEFLDEHYWHSIRPNPSNSTESYQIFFPRISPYNSVTHFGWEKPFDIIYKQKLTITDWDDKVYTTSAQVRIPVAPIDENAELNLKLDDERFNCNRWNSKKITPDYKVLFTPDFSGISIYSNYNIESFSIGSQWKEIYDHCFDFYSEWQYLKIFAPNNQWENINMWDPQWTIYDYAEEDEIWMKIFHQLFGTKENPTGQIKNLHFEGIDSKDPNYHLQLGNPYAWRSWEFMFKQMHSIRGCLHKYFDNYPVTVPINKVNPKGTEASGEPTETYYLTPADVDAMIDGYSK